MRLTALLVAKNEQELIGLCLEHILPFCDQIVVVDNGSTDNTKEIAKSYGVEVYDYPETQQMSDVRNFSLSKATGDWIMQVDADELYPASEMKKIREFIETTDAISARVHYKNLAWRS
jgi:glycosyltransferase involved in cell wall biosynthesis